MIGLLLLAAAGAAAAPDPAWLTLAERTGFRETARYEETLDYCRRLARESPWIRTTTFGTSPEGRDLILVIASKHGAFTPRAARRAGTPVVLIQAGIHAGEIAGKDAGLMLLRDIAIARTEEALLDRATLIFLPIYNVDGHERFGPYHRINQDGPAEMGWRVNARGLNLNRDYMKADAAETRAWLALFTSWWPDLTIDLHTTDGSDFAYDLLYLADTGPNVAEPVAAWLDRALRRRVLPAVERAGHRVAPYFYPVDGTDPKAGVNGYEITRPMLSNGYTVLHHRPSIVVEAHSLKDYATRVRATYAMLRALIEEVNRDPVALTDAVTAGAAHGARPGRVPLRFSAPATPREVEIEGVSYHREPSAISGAQRIVYGTDPETWTVSWPVGREVTVAVEKPTAYIVPAPWTEVHARLAAHGLRLLETTAKVTIEVEEYRLTNPVWADAPFEGHHTVTFDTAPEGARVRTFPPGSIVVPMDQPSSHVAVHLLEPQSPDALVSWGFFDVIFERREYAERYALESIARAMLRTDPSLQAEFDRALEDPEFAADPARRLEFFWRRSPWWDEGIGLYPVGRIRGALPAATRPYGAPGAGRP